MSSVSKRKREVTRAYLKGMGDHNEFLKRITNSLYYGKLPSLPVTELSCSVWSAWQRGRSVRRLHAREAAELAGGGYVQPSALVLALIYLGRLQQCNPDYLAATPPNELFLVSLMVGNKFLQDNGEDEEVLCSEWAESGDIEVKQLKKLEMDFLKAIDWKVFVSDETFEAGLSWVERHVALRQGSARGFFTYGELAAAEGGAALRDALLAATAALAGLLAVLASALLVSQVCLSPPSTPNALDTPASPDSSVTPPTSLRYNATTPDVEISESPQHISCCNQWLRFQERATPKKNWYDAVVINKWQYYEWLSETSVLNWLYQSSLVNPMQRWLEKLGEFIKNASEILKNEDGVERFGSYPIEKGSRLQMIGSDYGTRDCRIYTYVPLLFNQY